MRFFPVPLLLCCMTILPIVANGQVWELVGLRDYFWQVKQVYADTIHEDVYVVGSTSYLPDTGISFYRFHDQQWDTLGLFDQDLWTAIVWHDTLMISGGFYSINGDSIKYIAYWDTVQWQAYGQHPLGVQRFKVLNNELYALGGFDEADGQPATGIAKRVGGHWEPLPPLQNTSFVSIADIAYYQGHLVAVGNIGFTGNPYRDVMILNSDSTWSPIGPEGLMGIFSGATGCAVYQSDLYICGWISVNDGNAGQGVMRWDGSQWHDVGGGLSWAPGDFSVTCQATEMKVHDGLLFVSSGCHYAGNVPADGIAAWDGQKWCGLGGLLPEGCMAFDFLNDTLYANVVNWPDTSLAHPCTVVKYLRADYADTCSVPVGVVESAQSHPSLAAWIDEQGQLNLSGVDSGDQRITVFDGLGRTLGDFRVTPSASNCRLLLPPLPSGVYIAHVHDQGSARFVID